MQPDFLASLEQQLESVNLIKQENDKEIKRCRKIIQEKLAANESLQNLSNKLYKQIQELKNPSINVNINTLNAIATNNPSLTVSDLTATYYNGDVQFNTYLSNSNQSFPPNKNKNLVNFPSYTQGP